MNTNDSGCTYHVPHQSYCHGHDKQNRITIHLPVHHHPSRNRISQPLPPAPSSSSPRHHVHPTLFVAPVTAHPDGDSGYPCIYWFSRGRRRRASIRERHKLLVHCNTVTKKTAMGRRELETKLADLAASTDTCVVVAAAGGVRERHKLYGHQSSRSAASTILECTIFSCFNLVSGTDLTIGMIRKRGSETRKGDFAGKPFGFLVVLIAMKADGSEYAHSFKYPLSAHFDHRASSAVALLGQVAMLALLTIFQPFNCLGNRRRKMIMRIPSEIQSNGGRLVQSN